MVVLGLQLNAGNTAGDVSWILYSGYPAAGDFNIRESGVANHFVIKKTTGSVGIGNASPTFKLQVNGDIRINSGTAFLDDGQSIRWGGTAAKIDGSSGGDYLRFYTDGVERMRIISGGAVGIGTATPNAAGASTNNSIVSLKGKAAAYGGILELINYGTSGNGQSLGLVRFLDNTNENAQIEVTRHSATDDANMQFKTRSTGGSLTTRLLINASGTVTFNSAFTFPTTDGSAGQVLQTNGSGTVTWSTVSGGGGVSGSGNANYIPKFTGSSAIGNSTIYTDGQDVAIGSTAFGVGGTIDLSVGSPGSTAGGITLWNTTTGTHSIGFGDANSGTARYEGYLEYSHADNSMRFGTVHAERMRVTSDGNVGIGTNAPLDKLDVYGTGAIFRNLSDDADSVQIVRGTNHTASPDAKFYIYDNSSADWAAKINLDGASYGLDITGGVNYFLLCRDASGNRMFEVHNTSVVVNDGSTDMDFRVEGNGDDYLLFTDGGNDRVAISTNTPAAKLHVEGDFKVGASNNGNWMGYKDVAMNGSSYTTALTINLANHTACHVKLFLSGDWSGHSAVAFVGEYFIQNSADGYQEPGQIISEFDNTNTDLIMSKIVDPSSDTFTIQLKLSTTANGSFTGKLSYHVMGMATAVS